MNDPYNLNRFVEAQDAIFETALGELRSGLKQSHWMWFIFPQLRGLGHSPAAQFYGIGSAKEARSYLDHPPLGGRLNECVEALLSWEGRRSAEQILGAVDAMKLESSLTLFDVVDPGSLFAAGLEAYFFGRRDQRTLALLNASR
jgi:uncharacterized protein (DUF1810 family)